MIKDNPDLRGLGGCWCTVMEVREFSCLVRTWNSEYNWTSPLTKRYNPFWTTIKYLFSDLIE
ncbi:MAG: hypothetical protein EWV92_08400 [Microcystis aeruginosa Ma_MB_S_20031200_S102]|uniref:Uncharacterized protein n=1 Tax=Microcystis aeruginosa Ma_MB_S_20031200_S102 TaxID=2486254 RepID=A0A552EV94_MICAE|nr:MAG: hypothetical protein EWV79_17820 [Microcystis aeruginosa Ma_MB_S_20031200_S102D]TRU38385.1 MAG: hypothetical protein EWV92_08400 [Microcystis aeruginosa Ma_MB_S_20031200_S102]